MELDTNRSMYIMEFVRTLNSFSLILFFSFAQWFIALVSFFSMEKKNKQTEKKKKLWKKKNKKQLSKRKNCRYIAGGGGLMFVGSPRIDNYKLRMY